MTGATILLVAGEASGDQIGGRLIAALRQQGYDRFIGVGGPAMAAQGLVSAFDFAELSLVGVSEVLRHIPNVARRARQVAALARAERPAAVVFIDVSGFARMTAKRLAGSGLPVVQVKAPHAWAYWPRRAHAMRRHFAQVLAILPFEPAFFARYGVACTFIGHPSLESGAGHGDRAAWRTRHGIGAHDSVVLLLPGSRGSEVRWSLPLLRRTADLLHAQDPGLVFVATTIEPVAARVAQAMARWPARVILETDPAARFDAMAAADVAAAVGGTVTVELALAGVPHVMAYRVSPLTAAIARRALRIRHYTIANLLLEREAVPELVQEALSPEALAAATWRLLATPAARARQLADFAELARRLSAGAPPSVTAARLITDLARAVDRPPPPPL
ncbi:lipid-A-disaccharide synthase [Zavarzinia sp. CC-PAN008]|uniref:lipid-A-disaccharide synthase n=1 Tax=Zavarzinia sp. CC-PAN008 TaxID=3243332 RepID=UPI003F742D9B